MNLGLLAPLFAAGLALVAIPWIIHRIRRPIHKPVRFGSLMFVPQVRRDILKRRKIEHPWLMLLRMLLLALLAAAFMRPFWLTPASAAGDGRPFRHVILLDTSASMRTQGWFEAARAEAERLLAGMGARDEVAVVAFAGAPRVLAPLADARDAGAGTVRRAREAIGSARPGYEATAYVPALQAAEALLLPPEEGSDREKDREAAEARLIVHLVTDFQRAGMPETAPPWKLDPRIELHAVEVGEAAPANAGLVDLAIDEAPLRALRVRGKVASWRERDGKPVDVTLVADGAPQGKQSVAVKPGNTPQVIFTLPSPGRGAVEGWLELPGDALDADNRHYFAWNPPPRRDLLLVADGAPGNARSAARFAQLALPEGEVPWSVREAAQDALPSLLADAARAPEVVLAADLKGLDEAAARALIEFVRGGGGALLMLNATIEDDAIVALLGGPVGLGLGTSDDATAARPAPFATFSWVDLDHPMFMPFRDARHSDFSAIRLTDYHRLETRATPGTEAPRILARLDNGDPAIIEAHIGEGRMQLWTFGLDLESTNLPRLATFVPLLHESLASLTRASEGTARRGGGGGGGGGRRPPPPPPRATPRSGRGLLSGAR